MATNATSQVVRYLRRILLQGEGGLSDGQLLARYIDSRDEAAFAALVRRHGRLVWGVCRRLLNQHDAEDAFQATFLVLCRKAASIRRREMLASWLYGVAHQTALRARRTAMRRRAREKQVLDMPEPAVVEQDLWSDLQPLLDQELSRLSDDYQVVLLLCDLEGKTRKEVARQLNLPEGTVASRLARARTTLAKRLARHGLAVSGGALAAMYSQNVASAEVPFSLVFSTVKAASTFAGGKAATTGAISVKVAALTEGVVKAMFLSKLKTAMATLLLIFLVIGSGLLTASVVGSRQPDAEDRKPETPGADAPKKDDLANVAASAVLWDFNTNEALGDEKYTGKRVQVTGKMIDVRRRGEKYYLKMIPAKNTPPPMQGIPMPWIQLWFEFDAKDRKQLAALGYSSLLTVRGQCDGRTNDGRTNIGIDGSVHQVILFRNCEIVEAKPSSGR